METLDISCDVYRRWLKVSQLIPQEGNLKIIDIGGNPEDDSIKMFIPHEITAINPQYNGMDGTKLNYPDNSFDIAISIDTLEHVDKENREAFISEMVRVSKDKVILACPFDEPFVAEFESMINSIVVNQNLDEHIKNGLPILSDVLSIINSMNLEYTVYDNDSLVSWGSYLLLNNLVRNSNMANSQQYHKFKRLLNHIYNPDDDIKMSYRKIIEVDVSKSFTTGDTFAYIDGEHTIDTITRLGECKSDPEGFVEERGYDATQVHMCPKLEEFLYLPIEEKKKVSIIIPTFSLKFLDECIKSIEENTIYPNYEIIIVNDGVHDQELSNYLKETKHYYVNLEENVGFGRANNAGFQVAHGDYLMTLNVDTKVSHGWLTKMVEVLESSDDVGVVYPTILKMGTNLVVGKEWVPNPHYPSSNLVFRTNDLGDVYLRDEDTQFDTLVAPGVCMLFRKESLFDVGMFSEEYYNGCEDYDLCLKFNEKGFRTVHAPTFIEHYVGGLRNFMDGFTEALSTNKNIFLERWREKLGKIKVTKEEPEDGIDIIVILEGDESKLISCVNSVIENCNYYNFNLILLDKSNNKELREKLETLTHKSFTINLPTTYVETVNIAVNLGTSKYVLVINDSVTVRPGFLKKLKKTIDSNDNIGMVCPTFIDKEDNIISRGFRVDNQGVVLIDNLKKYNELGDSDFEVQGVHNECMLLRREVLHECKKFNRALKESLFDLEFCLSAGNLLWLSFNSVGAVYLEDGLSKFNNEDLLTFNKLSEDNGFKLQYKKGDEEWVTSEVVSTCNPTKVLRGDDSTVNVVDSTYQKRYSGRNEEKWKLMDNAIEFKDKVVADMGCNNGFFSFKIAESAKQVYAVDVDLVAIENAKKSNIQNINFMCSDIDLLNLVDTDITLFLSVYHHLINEKGIDKARKVLMDISKHTDTMIFECGQRNEQGSFEWKNKLPENFSTPDEIVDELKAYSEFDKFILIGELPIHGINRYLIVCEKS